MGWWGTYVSWITNRSGKDGVKARKWVRFALASVVD